MDFYPFQDLTHEDEELYEDRLTGPDSTLQSSTLRHEHEDLSYRPTEPDYTLQSSTLRQEHEDPLYRFTEPDHTLQPSTLGHEHEETSYRLTEPDYTFQPSALRHEHEDPSLIGGDETSHQQAMLSSPDLDDMFGPNAEIANEYFQNMEAHQPFWQEAPTIPVSNSAALVFNPAAPISDITNNIDDFHPLFNHTGHDQFLGAESDQMSSFSQFPNAGQAAYPNAGTQMAVNGPDYGGADFAGSSELNEGDEFANVRDQAYMSSQTSLPLGHSKGPFPPVSRELMLKSNRVYKELDENSASSFQSTNHTASDATRAPSHHFGMQWPGMERLLSDPEGLLTSQNTNVVLDQAGAFSTDGGVVPKHRQRRQDPGFIEYNSMQNSTHTEMPGYQGWVPQNKPYQDRGSIGPDVSNGNWLDLERNLLQPNDLPYPSYPARRRRHGPLPTSRKEASDMTADQFLSNSRVASSKSYLDGIFNGVPHQSQEMNGPHILHQQPSYIYEGAIPFNTNMTGHQRSVDDGYTSVLDLQTNTKPYPRKRSARFDEEEEEEEGEDAYVDSEDEYEQLFGGDVEDGSTQTSDYAPGNQELAKRRKTTDGYIHHPGINHSIHHQNTSWRPAGAETEATHTTKFRSGTRHCAEKGSFGNESKWWSRETPETGLQVREKESDIWRYAIRHDDIRQILFRRAGNVNQYTSPRAKGQDPGDETSYLESQKNWSLENRAGWKNIEGNVLMRYERKDYRAPDAIAKPRGYMKYRGRVVIDRNNRPILDWPMLPATLSTRFEGGYMEAIRRICPDINTRDFWARMPRWAKAPSKFGGYDSRPAPTISGINMRGLRFRQQNGLIAWTTRSGSEALKEKVKGKMSQADRDNNTTENVYM